MNNNKIYNIIRVSDLTQAEAIKNLVLFGYDPTKPVKEQSVRIPYALFKSVFDTKQDKLVAGDLVELKPNADGTVTINVLSDDSKQDKLVNTDGTVILTDNGNGTTDIKAVFTDGIQTDNIGGTKLLNVTNKIVNITSPAQIVYTGFTSELNVIKFINTSNLEVYFSLDNPGAGNNKILKDAVISSLIVPRYGAVEMFKTPEGWLTVGLYGLTYFRDLADSLRDDEYNVLVKPNGTAAIEVVKDIEELDESSSSLTAAQLNERYPNAVGGFRLITKTMMYIKSSHYDNTWVSSPLTKVN